MRKFIAFVLVLVLLLGAVGESQARGLRARGAFRGRGLFGVAAAALFGVPVTPIVAAPIIGTVGVTQSLTAVTVVQPAIVQPTVIQQVVPAVAVQQAVPAVVVEPFVVRARRLRR